MIGGLNKLYSFYMAAIVGTVSSRDLSIDAHHRNQHNRSELVMYSPLLHFNSSLERL